MQASVLVQLFLKAIKFRARTNMQSLTMIVFAVVLVALVQGYPLIGHHEHHDDHHSIDYHAHPKYTFKYGVHDSKTGDVKDQWETRDGDVVKGSYTLFEADGTKRIVDYTADKHSGFNAVVRREGHAIHPQHYKHHFEHHDGGY